MRLTVRSLSCCSRQHLYFSEVPKMSLQGGCLWLLVLGFVVIGASPLTGRTECNCTCPQKDPATEWLEKLPPSCVETMTICTLPFLPYIGLNETEIVDKFRKTSLSKHCKDLTKLGKCARRTMKGASCSEVTADFSTKFLKILGIYDFGTRFVCKKNFDKFNRNFRCITSQDVHSGIQSSCNITLTGLSNICEDIRRASNCASEVVKVKCGVEASSVTRELDVKLADQIASVALDKECSKSNIAKQLAVVKRVMFRK